MKRRNLSELEKVPARKDGLVSKIEHSSKKNGSQTLILHGITFFHCQSARGDFLHIKENLSACTMPLSSTSPIYVTPEIMRNQQYAREYLEHVALTRELLDQASLSTTSTLLSLSNNSQG